LAFGEPQAPIAIPRRTRVRLMRPSITQRCYPAVP
jgi:hypothetical protein